MKNKSRLTPDVVALEEVLKTLNREELELYALSSSMMFAIIATSMGATDCVEIGDIFGELSGKIQDVSEKVRDLTTKFVVERQ